MLLACYDAFRRLLSASEVNLGRLGGPVGVLGVILGAPWGALGGSWGVSGVLGEPLGGPWASLGAPSGRPSESLDVILARLRGL